MNLKITTIYTHAYTGTETLNVSEAVLTYSDDGAFCEVLVPVVNQKKKVKCTKGEATVVIAPEDMLDLAKTLIIEKEELELAQPYGVTISYTGQYNTYSTSTKVQIHTPSVEESYHINIDASKATQI